MAAPAAHLPRREFDNFPRVARFLDPHLTLAVVVNFVKQINIYDANSILEMELALASRTKLATYAVEVFRSLHGEEAPVPAALLAAEEAVPADLESALAACGPLVAIVGLDEPTAQLAELRRDGLFKMEFMREVHGVQESHVEALLLAAKFRYDVGLYRPGLAYLELYEELRFSKSDDVPLDIFWGKFAASILDNDPMWEKAEEERMNLADAIRRRPIPDIQRLQQRAWLLHWSLFILANYPKRREALIEFFMLEENLNAVTLTCPWLLRYVIAAVLPHRKKKDYYTKALTRMLTPEALALKDPIISFMHAVIVLFDFELAEQKLADCCSAIATDFFLSNMVSVEDFLASARSFLFDVYCRVCQTIDLGKLAAQVQLSADEAEKWVVGLVRSAQLDAKVDSTAKTVTMLQPPTSLHWLIADRTRDVAQRTRALLEHVENASERGGR